MLVLSIYTRYKGQIFRRKRVALPDLLEGDKLSSCYRVLHVVIPPSVFEIFAKKIDYVLFLSSQER